MVRTSPAARVRRKEPTPMDKKPDLQPDFNIHVVPKGREYDPEKAARDGIALLMDAGKEFDRFAAVSVDGKFRMHVEGEEAPRDNKKAKVYLNDVLDRLSRITAKA